MQSSVLSLLKDHYEEILVGVAGIGAFFGKDKLLTLFGTSASILSEEKKLLEALASRALVIEMTQKALSSDIEVMKTALQSQNGRIGILENQAAVIMAVGARLESSIKEMHQELTSHGKLLAALNPPSKY